jgi:predicted alpha/beta-fold hydrolase
MSHSKGQSEFLKGESILVTDFEPLELLRNPHLMTLAPSFIPRGGGLKNKPVEKILFEVDTDSKILGYCHFHPDRRFRPTLILVHGLEGSSQSYYILGLAERAFDAGANTIRLNLRNCGETLHLTPKLYNAGLSEDLISVLKYLSSQLELDDLFLVGFSLGGNLVLKAAAELNSASEKLRAVVSISPPIDLEACVARIESGFNRFYEAFFLMGLKGKIRAKARLFPNRFASEKLLSIRSLRLFDDIFTAPDGGYKDSEEYYRLASSSPKLRAIRVPTLIITAQDDPLIPFSIFRDIESNHVKLLAPKHGGHTAFIQAARKDTDQRLSAALFSHFWADDKIIRFSFANSQYPQTYLG